jgi:hypothetical protein
LVAQGRLPLKRVLSFLELFLVEQLATHDAVDLRTQGDDPHMLHFPPASDR